MFDALAEQMGSRSLAPSRDEASLDAGIFGFAERLEMDKQGRVALPRHHLELTGLAGDVAVIGAGNRLEVYDRAAYQAARQGMFERLPDVADRMRNGRAPGADTAK